MPAPSAPTALAVVSRANPDQYSLGYFLGGVQPALKLGWTWNGGDYAQIEMRRAGTGDYRSLTQARLFGLLLKWEISGTAAALLYGMEWNATYDFRVRAVDGGGVSAWTTLTNVATGNAATAADLLAPANLTITSNTGRGVVLGWDDNQNRESGYELEIVGSDGISQPFITKAFEFSATAVPTRNKVPVFGAGYTAKVRAFLRTSGAGTFYGPWSNEVFFVAAAEAIALRNLPATVVAWRNVPFSWTAWTSIPAVSWGVVSGLPAGLSAAAGVVSGTPTDAVGLYSAGISVTNGNTDTQTLTIDLRQPRLSLLFAAENSVEFVSAADALAIGISTGSVGEPLLIQVAAVAVGPLPTAITVTLDGAPDWLTVSGQNLSGTPPGGGSWSFAVTGTNATGDAAGEILQIDVPGVRITSAASVSVHAAQPFEFPLTAAPAASVFTAVNPPGWIGLTAAALGPQKLRGTAPSAGETSFALLASLGGETATQVFTVRAVAIFACDAEWDMILGRPTYQTVRYLGAGIISQWLLIGAPPGLSISAVAVGSYTNHIAAVEGTPGANGFYDAIVAVRVQNGADVHYYTTPVLIVVAGGLFVPWLHSDPHLFDLQVQVRGDVIKRIVQSYYATSRQIHPAREVTSVNDGTTIVQNEPAETERFVFTLKRGDTCKLAILIRDGEAILTTGITNVQLVLREPEADREDEYLLSGTAALVDSGGGHSYFGLTLEISSDIIDAIFDRDARAQIDTLAELSWEWNGDTFTALNFPVAIIRDENR